MTRAGLLLLTLSAGCALHRAPSWRSPDLPFGTVSDEIIDALEADGDRAWSERRDPARIEPALQAWRAALRYRPTSVSLLVRLSQGARRYARTQIAEKAATALDQAVAYAERALSAGNEKLRERASANRRPADVFAVAEVTDLPALMAYADALFDWSELGGTATLLAYSDWIHAAAARGVELQRAFQYGAPDRLIGTLDTALPLSAGGDLQAAMERFELAVASAPAYLPNKVAYAERYAARLHDGRLHRRLLEEVMRGDPGALPEAAPENEEAQRQARRLLKGG